MEHKASFILIEFEYQHTYLYEYCNRLKRILSTSFVNFDEESDINDFLRFTDEQEIKIVRVTPTRAGIIYNLEKWTEKYSIENIIKEISADFNKVFSGVCSVLQLDNCFKEVSAVISYEIEGSSSLVKSKLLSEFLNGRNKNIADFDISIDTSDTEAKDSKKSLRISNDDNLLKIVIARYYGKDANTFDMSENIKNINEECHEIISEILN